MKNQIKKEVMNWVEMKTQDYDGNEKAVFEDLQRNGCISGMVSELIYYSDTVKFYNSHKKEIFSMVEDFCEMCGETLKDFLLHANNFPLDKKELERETFVNGITGLIRKNADYADQIKNWFAWFAFEETAYKIYQEKYEN